MALLLLLLRPPKNQSSRSSTLDAPTLCLEQPPAVVPGVAFCFLLVESVGGVDGCEGRSTLNNAEGDL